MTFKLGARSNSRLKGVHPDLVAVVSDAIKISPIDFTVLEGLRTLDRQKELFASGATRTLNSRHLSGHAVDIAPYIHGRVSWHWPHYDLIEVAMKTAARQLDVDIEWGGDWTTFKDGPHWQLSWREYP
jgi:peptidoglycan L-alanyl-D-glutamate endopeptidase CwlK